MYFRDTRFKDYTAWFTRFLGFLRATTVTLLAILLLSPFVKTTKEDTKTPIILIAEDKSSSMSEGAAVDDLGLLKTNLQELEAQLGQKYDIKRISFSSDVQSASTDSFTGKSTNFSNLFNYISDNYSDQNLGAVILSSDGIYNEGSNPLYSESKFNAPLYTVATGDTTQKKDVYFQNILHNKIAYLGDKFSIQADISAFNCMGSNTKLTLEMISAGQNKKIAEENIAISSKSFFTSKTFIIDANQSGVVRYRLTLSPVKDEYNSKNNTKEFFIEILDARQKILLLANAPHPDLSALKSIITSNKNYEVDIAMPDKITTNVANYNMVILHNLPSPNHDIGGIISQLDKNSIPKIFIVGMQTSLPKFNAIQEVISIKGNSQNNEEIQAEYNPSFTQFITSDQLKNKLKTFPPLITPFGEYTANSTTTTYLFQNIKKIKTNYPLIAFNEKNGIKTAVICGEGIWKWRLFDFLQDKNYDLVTELVNKTVQLTAVKADKRKFKASTSKNLYKDNETVLFDAQLYNDSYEMVNDPDVKLTIKDENNKEFTYTFSKTQNYYTLNADLFPQGSYSYTATTNYNGKLLSALGKFNVASIDLEQFDLTARHGLLKGLSEKYNGQMFYPNQISTLGDSLLLNPNIKPVMYQSTSTKSIIHLKWIFFLLMALLSIEWFLRRYFGNY